MEEGQINDQYWSDYGLSLFKGEIKYESTHIPVVLGH